MKFVCYTVRNISVSNNVCHFKNTRRDPLAFYPQRRLQKLYICTATITFFVTKFFLSCFRKLKYTATRLFKHTLKR